MSVSPDGRPAAPPAPAPADRMPPANLEVERALLSSLMLAERAYDDVADVVSAGDFYRAWHGAIFAAAGALRDRGDPCDPLTVAEELMRRGDWERYGGDRAFDEIIGAAPHAANASYYAAIVRDKSDLRRMIEAATATLADCYDDRLAADEVLARAEQAVYAVGARGGGEPSVSMAEAVARALAQVEAARPGRPSGQVTGLIDLDDLTGGLFVPGLTIVAARPSVGKTALCLGIACRAARSGVPSRFFSLEMKADELAKRLLSAESQVDGHRLRTGIGLSDDDREAVRAAGRRIAELPIRIDDVAPRGIQDIASLARRAVHRDGARLIILDYMQLMEGGPEAPRNASRQEQVSAQSRRLKILAGELGVPILCCCQLNRQAEARADKRPQLGDLRESGAIEQDADQVFLINRPEAYDVSSRPGEADIIVAKNRNGPTGTVTVAYRKHLAWFDDYYAGPGPDGGDF